MQASNTAASAAQAAALLLLLRRAIGCRRLGTCSRAACDCVEKITGCGFKCAAYLIMTCKCFGSHEHDGPRRAGRPSATVRAPCDGLAGQICTSYSKNDAEISRIHGADRARLSATAS